MICFSQPTDSMYPFNLSPLISFLLIPSNSQLTIDSAFIFIISFIRGFLKICTLFQVSVHPPIFHSSIHLSIYLSLGSKCRTLRLLICPLWHHFLPGQFTKNNAHLSNFPVSQPLQIISTSFYSLSSICKHVLYSMFFFLFNSMTELHQQIHVLTMT